jgi:deazaflavin-dependent oxidoreductase (nitroreductase family)
MLRVPGIRSVLGRMFGLITVTGWRSGRRYTTPIQHLNYESDFVILSQRHRKWWRNIEHEPTVRLQIGKKKMTGTAEIVRDEEALGIIDTLFGANPRVAGFYDIDVGADGDIDPSALESLMENMVVIRVRPD